VYGDYGAVTTHQTESQKLGRFPANTILDTQDGEEWRRYFYCAKASKNDRDEGLEEFSTKTSGQMTERKEGSAGITAFTGSRSPKKNNHPTVKPTELMRYLVRLVTPKGGTVLDPFMGSGSTGKAVACENNERNAEYKFIGIEKETEYCKIAEARIKYVEQSEQQQRLI
jgi:site-specific DNA-methyltransferase (adenine-specific)